MAVVLRAGSAQGFGLAVYILHDNGDGTVYGHMEKILVGTGQTVRADTMSLLGNRGQSTGPHLHIEVFEGASTVAGPTPPHGSASAESASSGRR